MWRKGAYYDFALHQQRDSLVSRLSSQRPERPTPGGGRAPAPGAPPAASQAMVTESLEFLASVHNYNHWVARTLEPYLGSRILEFGCGIGNVLEFLLLKEQLIGIDLDPAMIDHCREKFAGHTNCRFQCMDIFEDELDFEGEPDTVISLNVIEHIEDDRRALRWMADQLPSGGSMVLFVPAHPTIYGEIDRAAGHHRRYEKQELISKVEGTGCKVVDARSFNLVGYFGWGLNARLLRKRDIPTKQALFYDRFVAPLQAWAENLVRPPFGQSLIVAARKI